MSKVFMLAASLLSTTAMADTFVCGLDIQKKTKYIAFGDELRVERSGKVSSVVYKCKPAITAEGRACHATEEGEGYKQYFSKTFYPDEGLMAFSDLTIQGSLVTQLTGIWHVTCHRP